MRNPVRGRKSLRDALLASKAADSFYAAIANKPSALEFDIKPVRKRAAAVPSGNRPEREILLEVRDALRAHPSVAAVWRIAAGTFRDGDRFIRAAPRGMPDIIGILTSGVFYGVECKSATGRIEPHQQEFIDAINANGGIAFIARSGADVDRELGRRLQNRRAQGDL